MERVSWRLIVGAATVGLQHLQLGRVNILLLNTMPAHCVNDLKCGFKISDSQRKRYVRDKGEKRELHILCTPLMHNGAHSTQRRRGPKVPKTSFLQLPSWHSIVRWEGMVPSVNHYLFSENPIYMFSQNFKIPHNLGVFSRI